MNDKLKNLRVQDVQADELWGFCKMKARTKEHKNVADETAGSFYNFVGIESNSKLVLAWHLGSRDSKSTVQFIAKLSNATSGRFQLSTDGLASYRDGVIYSELGERFDLGQLIKIYESGKETKMVAKRYSPCKFFKAIPQLVWGNPDADRLSTSHIERMNLSIRMQMRRMTRLTYGFSRKWENLKAAFALYFAFYNFVRPHKSLDGATPAMAQGIERTFWAIEDLLRY